MQPIIFNKEAISVKKIPLCVVIFLSVFLISGIAIDTWAGTSEADFKVTSRGTIDYTVDVSQNVGSLNIMVTGQSQMLNLDVFQPGSERVSCSSTTWTSSVGLKNPVKCSFNNPKPGVWKVKVTGSVHVGNVDKYPYVTGRLTVKMTGGQPKSTGIHTKKTDDEAPPGHPKVDVPKGSADRSAQIAEAGTWFPGAATIEYDSHLKGYIKKGDYDMYKFYFPGGTLKAYSKGNLDLVADLFNAKQEQVARDRSSGSGNNFMFQGQYPAGLYYIQIRVMYHGGQGPYELILGNGQGWSFIEDR